MHIAQFVHANCIYVILKQAAKCILFATGSVRPVVEDDAEDCPTAERKGGSSLGVVNATFEDDIEGSFYSKDLDPFFRMNSYESSKCLEGSQRFKSIGSIYILRLC
jgi:hypothetical protein